MIIILEVPRKMAQGFGLNIKAMTRKRLLPVPPIIGRSPKWSSSSQRGTGHEGHHRHTTTTIEVQEIRREIPVQE